MPLSSSKVSARGEMKSKRRVNAKGKREMRRLLFQSRILNISCQCVISILQCFE